MLKTIRTYTDIPFKNGYTEKQIIIALKHLNNRGLVIEFDDINNTFNILDTSSDIAEYLNESTSLSVVVEIGFDCLRTTIEDMLRVENSPKGNVEALLIDLNSMFKNVQYEIKENNDGVYLNPVL